MRRCSAASASSEADPDLLEVIDVVAGYRGKRIGAGRRREPTIALRGASFSLERGSCLAVVGESGSGKTTLGRCLAGLHRPSSGEIRFAGQALAGLAQARPPDLRRRIQLVFQDPESSLNPAHVRPADRQAPAPTVLPPFASPRRPRASLSFSSRFISR